MIFKLNVDKQGEPLRVSKIAKDPKIDRDYLYVYSVLRDLSKLIEAKVKDVKLVHDNGSVFLTL